jgi:hypothetical protein
MRRTLSGNARMPRLVSALLIAVALFLPAAPAFAQEKPVSPAQGHWRFEKDAANAANLSFVRDGKVVFLLRAGREISLWIAWPGALQPPGKAQVTIQTSSRRWRMNGELMTEEQGGTQSSYFVQRDMGLNDRKKRFGDLVLRYNRFMEAIIDSAVITITTKAGLITLPAVDIADARQQMQL